MRVAPFVNVSIFAALAVATFSPGFALAEVYIPEGSAGSVLRLGPDLDPVSRLQGLGNVHGMDVALSRGVLVAASLDEQPRSEIKKPKSVSASDHAAHHSKDQNAVSGDVSLISLVDLKSEQIIRQIEVPGMVHHVAVGGNDRYVLVTHPGLDAVSIIDLDTYAVTATIQTGPNPNYAVFDPTTGSFFVSIQGNSTISQIDPVQGYVLRNFKTPAGAEHLAIDVPGRRLFAAEVDADELSVLNLDTGAIEATYQIGGALHGVVYDAARNAAYVSVRETGDIAWIDLSSAVVNLKNIGAAPYHMALDGDRLVVSSAEDDLIWIVDVPSRGLLKTIPTNARGHQMVVIPSLE